MTFYQELQLNQSGSKELIRQSTTTKEKLYHIAVYLFKIAITVLFCFLLFHYSVFYLETRIVLRVLLFYYA